MDLDKDSPRRVALDEDSQGGSSEGGGSEGGGSEGGGPQGEFVHRHSRRLSDKVLFAFHHACDLNDLEIAEQLLQILESMTTRSPRPEDGNRRRNLQGLVAAHERLWHLRHPSAQ